MKYEEQVGCGYCIHEKSCKIHNPKDNKAKRGCVNYSHYSLNEPPKKITSLTIKQIK